MSSRVFHWLVIALLAGINGNTADSLWVERGWYVLAVLALIFSLRAGRA